MTNKLIISDNLIALQKMEAESIDCILTDPPYNTTNNKLTYKDNRKDQEWLDFMEPRMRECHRILKKTGTLLIFIDSNMQAELQMLLYKVFNKRNYITTFIWKKKTSSSAQSKFATVEHEYIIAVAKDIKHCRWNGLVQFEAKDKLEKATAMVNASSPNQSYPLYVRHGNDPADTDSLFDQHGASREKGNDNNKYPLYVQHGDDKNDIITELKKVGNTVQSYRETMDYPLYIEQDVYDAQRLDKVSKTDRNPETRPEAVYPLYASTPNYPAEGHNISPDDPMYMGGRDGYGGYKHINLWGTGVFKQNKEGKFPLATDGQRISLTPFPGSVEIKPMNGTELGCWRCIPATCQKLIDANMLVVKKNKKGEYKIYQKQYAHYQFNKKTGQLEPFIRTTPIRTILQGDDFPTNLRSNKEIKEIFGRTSFTYSKPTELVKNLLKVVCNEGDIVLDIFAGSGTTGQAAFEINRKFILIQLDEANIPELIKIRLDKKVGAENYEVINEKENIK